MFYLHAIEVRDFWGNHRVSFECQPDVNFLIGVNGSGKTTILNLIASVLDLEWETLLKIEFSSIDLTFRADGRKNRPVIRVEKDPEDSDGQGSLLYRIKEKTSDSFQDIPIHLVQPSSKYPLTGLLSIENKLMTSSSDDVLREFIDKLIDFSWLHVHRASVKGNTETHNRFASGVDKKLDEVGKRLANYFLSLGAETAKLVNNFQEEFFFALLSLETEKQLVDTASDIDIEHEAQDLKKIFENFNLEQSRYSPKVDKFFKSFGAAVQRFNDPKGRRLLDDYLFIYRGRRLHILIERWQKLQKEIEKVEAPEIDFYEAINKVLNRKTIHTTKENEFFFATQSHKSMWLNNLSSGEKQLFILYAEATLQKGKPFIFFADEPELSLHVRWQSRLVQDLRTINPNCQIVFATHSPDIVGPFGSKTLDMETLVK